MSNLSNFTPDHCTSLSSASLTPSHSASVKSSLPSTATRGAARVINYLDSSPLPCRAINHLNSYSSVCDSDHFHLFPWPLSSTVATRGEARVINTLPYPPPNPSAILSPPPLLLPPLPLHPPVPPLVSHPAFPEGPVSVLLSAAPLTPIRVSPSPGHDTHLLWDTLDSSFPSSTVGISSHLRVCTYNVNGLKDEKLGHLSWLLHRLPLDFLAIIDSRHSHAQAKVLHSSLSSLAPGFLSLSSPAVSDVRRNTGGVVVIISPRMRQAHRQLWHDPSGLGLVMGCVFASSAGLLLVMATYWPIHAEFEAAGSLWTRASAWLSSNNIRKSPTEYIRSLIISKCDSHTKTPGNTVIILGDLNANPSGVLARDGDLHSWLDTNSLVQLNRDSLSVATRYSGDSPTGVIDHILGHQSSLPLCRSSLVISSGLWSIVSDHRPKIVSLDILIAPSRRPTTTPPLPPSPFPLDCPTLLKTFNHMLTSHINSFPLTYCSAAPDLLLEDLCRKTSAVASKLASRHAKKFKYGIWSPTMAILLCRLDCLIALQRRLRQCKSSQLHLVVTPIIHTYKNRISKYNLSDADVNIEINYFLFSSNLLLSSSITQLRLAIPSIITSIKDKLQGRFRMIWRSKISKSIRRRQRLFEAGKIGSVISSITGLFKGDCNLDFLELEDGSICHDPAANHAHASLFFKAWFAAPSLDSTSNFCPASFNWDEPNSMRPSFSQHCASLSIPVELSDIIWKAIVAPISTSRQQAADHLNEIFASPPSLAEFLEAIKNCPKKSAGGVTGVTYAMMKGWAPAIVSFVHAALCLMWPSFSTPLWFKKKILQPIPKAGSNPAILAGLRPLMMIEPLRKLWVGISIRKIRHCWEHCGVLQPTQYGFRSKRSCGSAILQLVNCLETAEEEASTIFLSSWDIRRAFDSISRPIMHLSLTRLGVPNAVASWFASMDADDSVVVRSPYSRSFPDAETFSTGQGTGQGDISSPDIWNSFMDMLLTALAIGTESDFLFKCDNDSLIPQRDLAYADDLISISARHHTLQRKADVVSAFALIFGLKINTDKLRGYYAEYGSESTLLPYYSPSLIIHGSNWTPLSVSLQSSGHFKHLGAIIDLTNTSETELAHATALVKSAVAVISRRAASAAIKSLVLSTCLLPKLAYKGQFACWSLSQCQLLDSPYLQAVRSAFGLMKSHPTALVTGHKELGGLGFSSPSTSFQLRKLALIRRGQQSDSATALAVDSLLCRVSRASLSEIPVDGRSFAGTACYLGKQTFWASSLLERLSLAGLQICRGSKLSPSPLDSPL